MKAAALAKLSNLLGSILLELTLGWTSYLAYCFLNSFPLSPWSIMNVFIYLFVSFDFLSRDITHFTSEIFFNVCEKTSLVK